MSRHVSSRYLFETVGNARTFRHQRCINNQIFECQTCHNVVGRNDPYSHHWLNVPDNQHIKLSLEEKKLLKRIELQRIQTFFLCDESARSRTNEFLLEAGIEAVPQLFRFLNYGANRLEVTIGFYVTVVRKRMYYESTPVIIGNHLDIKDTVDMLFSILLEKIASFVLINYSVPLEACAIKRIKVMVMRQMFGKPQVPLQYRVKINTNYFHSNHTTSNKVNIRPLHKNFASSRQGTLGNFPTPLKFNLYCTRTCSSTKEIFLVPYLLRSEDIDNIPTFLILTNVTGEFIGLHEIRDVRRFLKTDSQDHIFECRQCNSHFADRSQYALHKQINCGAGFVVWHIDQESTELYENCLLLPRQYFKFAWFGIGR